MANIKNSMAQQNEAEYKPKIKEIETVYYRTVRDIRTKVLQNLKVIREGQADTANQAFEKLLQEEKTKDTEIGRALRDIEMATKAAIGVAGDGDKNVIEVLNIRVAGVDRSLYEDMICKFYSAINHKVYEGVKGLRERARRSGAAGDDIDDFFLGQEDLAEVVKGIDRDATYQALLDLYGVKDSSNDPQLVMARLEYLFNFKPPVDEVSVVNIEIIIKTHVLMMDCIRTQFEKSTDPKILRELAKDPLTQSDDKYGVPGIYCEFMKQVKDKMFEDVDQNDQQAPVNKLYQSFSLPNSKINTMAQLVVAD